jgi:hypothetical protein
MFTFRNPPSWFNLIELVIGVDAKISDRLLVQEKPVQRPIDSAFSVHLMLCTGGV